MKHIRTYEKYRISKNREEIIKEAFSFAENDAPPEQEDAFKEVYASEIL